MLTSLTKGGGGVSQFLTNADKRGRGVQTPPNMADIICEQSIKLRLINMLNTTKALGKRKL